MSAFNLAQRIYIEDDGTICPITNMFDADGDETDEPDLVHVFVAKRSESEWLTINAREDCDRAEIV